MSVSSLSYEGHTVRSPLYKHSCPERWNTWFPQLCVPSSLIIVSMEWGATHINRVTKEQMVASSFQRFHDIHILAPSNVGTDELLQRYLFTWAIMKAKLKKNGTYNYSEAQSG